MLKPTEDDHLSNMSTFGTDEQLQTLPPQAPSIGRDRSLAPLPAPIRMMHSSRASYSEAPKWTVEGVSGHEKIVLHASVLQAGEDLMMLRLGYSVTATGYLRNPAALVP